MVRDNVTIIYCTAWEPKSHKKHGREVFCDQVQTAIQGTSPNHKQIHLSPPHEAIWMYTLECSVPWIQPRCCWSVDSTHKNASPKVGNEEFLAWGRRITTTRGVAISWVEKVMGKESCASPQEGAIQFMCWLCCKDVIHPWPHFVQHDAPKSLGNLGCVQQDPKILIYWQY